MFKYQELIDLLPIEKVNVAIKRMADCYDLTGNFYDKEDNNVYYVLNGERLLKKYFELSYEFISLLNCYAQKEYDEELSDDLSYFASIDTPDNQIEYQKERICLSILNYFEAKARKILDNREYLRIPVGKTVDFNECMLSNKYLDKIEFYKDGGWGIAEENGTVLVKNHLMKQPSKTYNLFSVCSHKNTPYRMIQDRDTKKYGILSYETFYETVHCLYDEIQVIDFYEESEKHFFIKAMKNGKWGCFDERCALIIDFEYEIIELISGYLECVRKAEYLLNESLSDRDKRYVIEGKRDLYNNEGKLLIGGYDNLFVEYDYMKFYFGSFYEYYEDEENDSHGYPVPLSKVRFNSQKSKCLVLDKEFKTIINDGNGFFRMPKGFVFKSLEEVEKLVPQNLLFRYRVDLSDLESGFIYLHDDLGEQFIIPDYIIGGFSSPEEMDSRSNSQKVTDERVHDFKKSFEEIQRSLGIDEDTISMKLRETDFELLLTPITHQYYKEHYIDDDLLYIIKIYTDGTIGWYNKANEVGRTFHRFYYRRNDKIGLYDNNGMYPAIYDAITLDSFDLKIYAASFEYCATISSALFENPNFMQGGRLLIHYYRINDDGTSICMADNWESFNPRKCKWFPYDFIKKYYGNSDRDTTCYDDAAYDKGYEWTDEDAWDAMTDGMYGDYPGSGWDPEAFGY